VIGGLGFWFPDAVKVEAKQGRGGMGAKYAAEVDSVAEVKDEQKLVRTADGAEVVSSSNVTVPLDPVIPLGSLVTVWPGGTAERTAVVLAVSRQVNHPPLPSHQVLWLE
jgi:hypothetical protein